MSIFPPLILLEISKDTRTFVTHLYKIALLRGYLWNPNSDTTVGDSGVGLDTPVSLRPGTSEIRMVFRLQPSPAVVSGNPLAF